MSLKTDMAKALIGVSNPNGGTRDMSQIAQQMAAGYFPGGNSSGLLPRRDQSFLSGSFGPSTPATPYPIDAANGQIVMPRRWQYPVGYNLPTPPGATKLVDFNTLEQLSRIYDVLRLAIGVRKQEIAQMKWEILPKDPELLKPGAEIPEQQNASIKAITEFFENPDPINGLSMDDWLKLALEEVLVKDALSIYPHPTWLKGKGPLGSSLFALEILDGKTIKPLLDIRGARPLPPNPAYQQFIWGIPRSEMETDYSSEINGLGDADAKPFMAADARGASAYDAPSLYYRPYERFTYDVYGFSKVEQIILNVNLALKRQQFHTTYFTEGTVPAGIINIDKELQWSPEQVREYEEGWNALLSGDAGWKQKVRVIPGSNSFSQLKPPIFDTVFDEWLARITCMGVDVTLDEIGLGAGSNNGLGGKGYGEAQENVTFRKSLNPITSWFALFFNQVIRDWFNEPDLQFKFIYTEADDELKAAQTDQILVSIGSKTPDEVRLRLGMDPYEKGLGDTPLLITRQGPILLEDINAVSKSSAGKNEDGTPKVSADMVTADGTPAKPLVPGNAAHVAVKPPEPTPGPPQPNAKKIAETLQGLVLEELRPDINRMKDKADLAKTLGLIEKAVNREIRVEPHFDVQAPSVHIPDWPDFPAPVVTVNVPEFPEQKAAVVNVTNVVPEPKPEAKRVTTVRKLEDGSTEATTTVE